jgi:uncharacterized protein (UPF0261 family)
MHAEATMLAAALQAHEGAIADGGPLRVFGGTVNTDLVLTGGRGGAVRHNEVIHNPTTELLIVRTWSTGVTYVALITLLSGLFCISRRIVSASADAIAKKAELEKRAAGRGPRNRHFSRPASIGAWKEHEYHTFWIN